MGIKYADLEIRWVELTVRKLPQEGQPAVEIKSELGYYHNGRWVSVGPGPTKLLDLQELYAAAGVTLGVAMPNLDPANDQLGAVLNTLAYGALDHQLPPPTTLTVDVVDASSNPVASPTGQVSIEVPGRDPVTMPLPVSGVNIERAAAQAVVRVTLDDGRTGTWTGALVGNVTATVAVS